MLPRVLYIAGYSRCGSTLLDILLNSHPQITSTGELTYLHDDAAAAHRTCTCGASYGLCDLYNGWLTRRPEGEAQIVRAVECRGSLRRLLRGEVTVQELRSYHHYGRSLFHHIGTETGARIVVDSSKSARDAAGRPLALQRLAGLDLRVIHLTRDPGRTVQSYLETGSNWVKEGHRASRPLESWRPVLGWALANGVARRLRSEIGDERYLHVRFEDLMADPAMTLGRIGAFADVDLSDVAQRVADGHAFQAGHSIGGNRARLKPVTVRSGSPSAARLPRPHALGLSLVGSGLARELGYA